MRMARTEFSRPCPNCSGVLKGARIFRITMQRRKQFFSRYRSRQKRGRGRPSVETLQNLYASVFFRVGVNDCWFQCISYAKNRLVHAPDSSDEYERDTHTHMPSLSWSFMDCYGSSLSPCDCCVQSITIRMTFF